MSERTQGIKDFKISTRIQDGLTSFSVNFLTPQKPSSLKTGEQFSITLFDTASPGQTTVLGGRIQKISRDTAAGGEIYAISGRDEGWFLVRNGYALDCSLSSNNTFTAQDALDNILQDTNITTYGGGEDLSNTTLHNNSFLSAGFCGMFTNKKEAINKLFKIYADQNGKNKIRWYIDSNSRLRWFETGKQRGSTTAFKLEDALVTSFKIEENAENIVNDLTGYGCDEETIISHQQDNASIARFGLHKGDDIKDSKAKTVAEVAAKVSKELKQKAWPIYTANLTLKKYYDLNVGQQVRFIDDPDWSNIKFTCTQKDITGNPADITTTLTFSTDETAIAPPTDSEIVKAVADKAVNDNKAQLGKVVDIDDDDCNKYLVKPYGSNNLVNARSTHNCYDEYSGTSGGGNAGGMGAG